LEARGMPGEKANSHQSGLGACTEDPECACAEDYERASSSAILTQSNLLLTFKK